MSYNLLFTFNEKIDWTSLHQKLSIQEIKYLEFIPIEKSVGLGENSSLAVSIPSKNVCPEMWKELSEVIHLLLNVKGTRGLDLISGKEIKIVDLNSLRQNIFL